MTTKILLPAFYLPPVSWFAAFLKEDRDVILEQYEHFPKQTYRSRTCIYGANGRLSLFIPIRHNGERALKDIEVSDRENWRKLHWKSIKTAYQSSPYFEFYEDQLESIFEPGEKSLLKINLKALQTLQNILKTDRQYTLTDEYLRLPDAEDYRDAFNAKKPEERGYPEYYQTFTNKYGFIEDLSILDLICNKGPETLTYIRNIG